MRNTETGEDTLISLLGLDALHAGVEAEVVLQPSYLVRCDVGAALSNRVYSDDVTGT